MQASGGFVGTPDPAFFGGAQWCSEISSRVFCISVGGSELNEWLLFFFSSVWGVSMTRLSSSTCAHFSAYHAFGKGQAFKHSACSRQH